MFIFKNNVVQVIDEGNADVFREGQRKALYAFSELFVIQSVNVRWADTGSIRSIMHIDKLGQSKGVPSGMLGIEVKAIQQCHSIRSCPAITMERSVFLKEFWEIGNMKL